jgi:sterol desaturase/sphingolipid hydroxylase (fatty acid hydroxylase superfamily)
MLDEKYGSRDKRGDWKPFKVIEYPPVIAWPPKPLKFVKWLFGYPGFILPWNLFYALVAVGVWFILPPMETFRTFAIGWIAYIWAINLAIVTCFFGFFHLWLYVHRKQESEFKYNARWLATDSSSFFLNNQTFDNLFYTYVSGVTFWTAWEAATLWLYANQYIPQVSYSDHPIYCTALFFVVVLWRDIHFYLVHRLIHWPPLYRLAHHVHHRNANIGPYSGLSMHPVEHFLYFSCVVFNWVVASHPVNALYNIIHAGMSPAPGHTGFDQMIVGDDKLVDLVGHDHYLHHKYFECNYADGVFPLDKWFGTFNDGTPESQAKMEARFRERARKAAEREARKAGGKALGQ